MTSSTPDPEPWTRPAWRSAAFAWIRERLDERSIAPTGEITQPHTAWWSTVMRVPTDAGVLWFKALRPKDAFEARLTPLLAELAPDLIVEVVAVDGERGWLLSRDAGMRLREASSGPSQVDHWEQLLPRYAELQIALADRVDELLELGVPDLRLATLPDALAATLEEPDMLMLGHQDGLERHQRARLRAELPAFRDLCARLAALGVPETLQHDDLNDGNVFVRGPGGGREGHPGDGHVVFDWGDACVSHPFHTLVVTLRAGAYRHGWQPAGPELARMLDAYLEPWQRLASRDELLAALDLARQTGTIQRALAWRRSAQDMPPSVRDEYVDAVPYGLRLYLMDAPWGTWDDGSF